MKVASCILLMLWICSFNGASGVFAQSAQVSGADAAQQVQDFRNLAEQLDGLMKNTETAKQRLDDGYKTLSDASKDMAGAEKFVDERIATLRALADRIKPGSPFMKLFDNAEGVLRRRAQEETSNADVARQKYGKPLNDLADDIAAARSRFRDMHDKFSKEIGNLERQKPIIQDLFLLNKGSEFKDEANKEYKIYQDLLGNMQGFGKNLMEKIAPNALTQ